MTDGTIVGGLLAAIGAALFLGSLWLWFLARQSMTWLSTAGTIISAGLVDAAADEDSVRTRVSYRLQVVYQYEVAGEKLQGNRISIGENLFAWTRRNLADQQMQRYKPGTAVTVYDDAARPRQSTLTRGADRLLVPVMVVAMLLVVAGVGAIQGWIATVTD